MQCACTILSCVAYSAQQYFFSLLHQWHNFRKKKCHWKYKYVFWFPIQSLYETLLIPGRTERDMIKNMYWFSHKITPYSSQILCNILDRFWTNTRVKFHKNPFSGSRVFHADGRTDGGTDRYDEAVVALCNFANAPKTYSFLLQWICSAWSRPARRDNLILDAVGKSDYFFVVVVCSPFTRWVQQVKTAI